MYILQTEERIIVCISCKNGNQWLNGSFSLLQFWIIRASDEKIECINNINKAWAAHILDKCRLLLRLCNQSDSEEICSN